MSGIAGMVRFDGQTIAQADTTNIMRLLRHRGAVLTHSFENGILMAFGGTIEVNKTKPAYAAVDADVFSKSSTDQPFTGNYIQNGPTSFTDINADFAVAIWDAQKQTLVCARDPLGVKPVYYVHQPGRFFAFASEIKALLALGEVVVKPNEHKYREYLTWITEYIPYNTETFYESIYSVLPGHYLQISSQSVSIRSYWTLDLKQFSGLSRAEDYASLFDSYFTNAVNSRMKGQKQVGAHLSGGLDSSSVSCVAQSLLTKQNRPSLHTFNIDPELASTDESEYVQAVIDQCHPHNHKVHPIADVLDSVLKINQFFDRPEQFIIPSSFHLSVSLEAQKFGINTILTGHDGDSTIPTCFEFLDELVDAADWETLQTASQQFVSYPERNFLHASSNWPHLSDQDKYQKFILYMIGSTLKKRFKEQSFSTFLATLGQQKQALGITPAAIMAYCYKRVTDKIAQRSLINNALSADFKQRVPKRALQSTKELTNALSKEHGVPIEQIINTTNIICNEQFNHIGAYYGHQYSFPFFDKHVIEVGLATPLAISFDHGRGRGLIRHGLQTVLPQEVISRVTKTNFVEYGTLSAIQLYEAAYEQFASPSHAIWEVIDRSIFAKIVAIVFNPRFPAQKKTRYNWLLSRIIYLALWLGSLPQSR